MPVLAKQYSSALLLLLFQVIILLITILLQLSTNLQAALFSRHIRGMVPAHIGRLFFWYSSVAGSFSSGTALLLVLFSRSRWQILCTSFWSLLVPVQNHSIRLASFFFFFFFFHEHWYRESASLGECLHVEEIIVWTSSLQRSNPLCRFEPICAFWLLALVHVHVFTWKNLICFR